jgi:hypothetical protein
MAGKYRCLAKNRLGSDLHDNSFGDPLISLLLIYDQVRSIGDTFRKASRFESTKVYRSLAKVKVVNPCNTTGELILAREDVDVNLVSILNQVER